MTEAPSDAQTHDRMNHMDTWVVTITTRTFRGTPTTPQAAHELQQDLIAETGRTGEPGVDPEVALTNDGTAIRQTFPMVDAYTAVQLASESLRRQLAPDDVEGIQVARLDDWLRANRP